MIKTENEELKQKVGNEISSLILTHTYKYLKTTLSEIEYQQNVEIHGKQSTGKTKNNRIQ